MKKLSPVVLLFLVAFVILHGTAVATDYTTPIPLLELGEDTYFGVQGGLYPNGQNVPPAAYLAQLESVAATLAGDSQLVIVGIGPSIMQNSISGFAPFLNNPEVNDSIIFVDGSLGSNQQRFEDPDYFGWDVGIDRLPSPLTAADVDVVFYYNALTGPSGSFPDFVEQAADSFQITYEIIADKFPNVQLVLQNSQHYAGWCGACKAPEPYAYYNGFAVKELIRRRIDGEIGGPLIAWNAYQWDSTWPSSYYSDGLHLSGLGQQATGQLWHDYLSTVSFAAPWYLGGFTPTVTPTAVATGTPTSTPTPSATPTVPVVTETPTPFPSDTPTSLPTSDPTITPTGCGRQGLPCPPTRTPVGG